MLNHGQLSQRRFREGIRRAQELEGSEDDSCSRTTPSPFVSYSSPAVFTSPAPVLPAPSPQQPPRWDPFLPLLPLSLTPACPMHPSTYQRRLPLLAQPFPARSSLTTSSSQSCLSRSRLEASPSRIASRSLPCASTRRLRVSRLPGTSSTSAASQLEEHLSSSPKQPVSFP